MIYHRIVSGDVFEIYLNLQELLCLKTLTKQSCAIIPNNISLNYFDLSQFDVVGGFPDNCTSVDLSDFVCVFNRDLNTQSGLDLMSKNKSTLFRLDKFNHGNVEVKMSKPSYYKDKYIYDDNISVELNQDFVKKYGFISSLVPNSHFIYLKEKVDFKATFDDYQYVSEITDNLQEFFEQNQIQAFDLKSFITNYHSSLSIVDFKALLLILKTNFTSVQFYPDCVDKWCLV
jgi:hypothetical protein